MALDRSVSINATQFLFLLKGFIPVLLHVLEPVRVNQDLSCVRAFCTALFVEITCLILFEQPLHLPNVLEAKCFLHYLLTLALDGIVMRLCYPFDQGLSKLGFLEKPTMTDSISTESKSSKTPTQPESNSGDIDRATRIGNSLVYVD
jgi:hypothetical protein